MLFGTYLIERGLVEEKDILDALDLQQRRQRPLGTIAVEMGILTSRQVLQVLDLQRKGTRERPFGQTAIQLGLITEADLVALIERQARTRPRLGEVMVELALIDKLVLDQELHTFFSNKSRSQK